jgi:hypothetical protein
MRWYAVFLSTISLWVYVTMPDVRDEVRQHAISAISETVHG